MTGDRAQMTAFKKRQESIFIFWKFLFICSLIFLIAYGCSKRVLPSSSPEHTKPYKVGKKWYKPLPRSEGFRQRGKASWYGKKFHGRKTASGEIYNMHAMTAAHKTLPLGTYVRVHNLENNRKIEVKINDRGPFVRGRIIDLSYKAAKKIGIVGLGTAKVEIVALGSASYQKTKKETERSYVPGDYYTGNFTFQVGAFTNRENAVKLKQKLDRKYKNAHIVPYNSGYETFYRVRVGKFSSLEEAIEHENILIKDGFEGTFIVAE